MVASLAKRPTSLLIAERDGERCAGPVLIAGMAVGVGVIQLSTQGLKQSSHLSLNLLSLLVLELIGPILVSVLGMALLLPRWIERVDHAGSRHWRRSVLSAALVGALLMLMFFSASLLSGILITPRSEMVSELFELIGAIRLWDVVQSLVRCAGFLAALCAWCQWRSHNALRMGHAKTFIMSNLLVEGLMIGLSLKVLWSLMAQVLPFQEAWA